MNWIDRTQLVDLFLLKYTFIAYKWINSKPYYMYKLNKLNTTNWSVTFEIYISMEYKCVNQNHNLSNSKYWANFLLVFQKHFARRKYE